jgi:hypothetical protein
MTYVDTLTIRLVISSDVIRPPTHELPIITFSGNKPYLALTTKHVAAADNQPAFLELPTADLRKNILAISRITGVHTARVTRRKSASVAPRVFKRARGLRPWVTLDGAAFAASPVLLRKQPISQ